jgi:hypothetical protein
MDTPIRSSSHQSRSIQNDKHVTHPTSTDTEDNMESDDSVVEIVEKPSEDAKAELGQLSPQIS